jgi:hypothetical protein
MPVMSSTVDRNSSNSNSNNSLMRLVEVTGTGENDWKPVPQFPMLMHPTYAKDKLRELKQIHKSRKFTDPGA